MPVVTRTSTVVRVVVVLLSQTLYNISVDPRPVLKQREPDPELEARSARGSTSSRTRSLDGNIRRQIEPRASILRSNL